MQSAKIIISGAGYTGLLTALVLLTSGIDCIIIEKEINEKLLLDDGKSFAISKMTMDLLKEVGVYNQLEKHVLPIKVCYCFENNQLETIIIDNSKLLAGMISSSLLKTALLEKLYNFKNFKLHTNYSWKEIIYDPIQEQSKIFSDGNQSTPDFIGDLIISTEGRSSKMLSYFTIHQKHYDYQQNAIVFNITHEIPHLQRAVEKFFSEGAIAILPMIDLDNKNHSAIVWINSNIYSDYIYNLSENEFIKLLNQKIDNILGKIEIVNFPNRKKYPLKLSFLTQYSHNNIVFLGDINHAIHPIAGQGFNLTILDIKQITKLLEIYNIKHNLEKIKRLFFRKRIVGNCIMIGFTHSLVKMFDNDNKILKFVRNKIIRIIDKLNLSNRLF